MDPLLVNSKEGLTTQQAQSQLQEYGPNEIYKPEKAPAQGEPPETSEQEQTGGNI
jgi:hypothetical protein